VELDKIKELMAAMEEGGIKKLFLKEENGEEIELVRSVSIAPKEMPESSRVEEKEREVVKEVLEEKQKRERTIITSPMVGTYYSSPSPDESPFVQVGDKVEEDTILCIIEAMKVMNEVKAGKAGIIAEIFVEDAHPVEFGTELFRIV
jgi:acetyl-CoA carboxylase biotin carboxyl carrier protein